MSFLHPGFLYAAAAASAVVVALHFLVAEQPRAGVLPTVRFFPDVDVRSTTLAIRLSDLLLLLIRVATLLLIGAAFAQPVVKPSKSSVLRIVAVDVSGASISRAAVADSAAPFIAGAADVVLFDSLARELTPKQAADSLAVYRAARATTERGSLSPAMIVALRAASRLRDHADSLDLVIVTPLLAGEQDSATMAIRSLWPGRIRFVRVASSAGATPVVASREWADSSASRIWTAKTAPDTIGGFEFSGQAVIYPFVRRWKLGPADSSIRVTGRWVDGEPAIVEKRTASGCVRSMGFSVPTKGDAMLRPSFVRFMRDAAAPCYSADYSPTSAETLAELSGKGGLAPTTKIAPESARVTPLVPWLLGGALVLTLIELIVRGVGRNRGAEEAVSFRSRDGLEREGKVA